MGVINDPTLDSDDESTEFELGEAPREPGKQAEQAEREGKSDLDVVFEDDATPEESFAESASADGEHDDAPAAPDEDDDDAFMQQLRGEGASESWAKRLVRERKVVRRERERADAAERERLAVSERLAQTNLALATVFEENLTHKIAEIRGKLITAKENGESEQEVKLLEELTEQQGRLREIKDSKARLEKEAQEGETQRNAPVPLARQWLGRNTSWFGKPGFERFTERARLIDREVAAAGFDKHDPTYYTELDRRIRKELPDLYQRLGVNTRGPGNAHAQGARGNAGKSAPTGSVRGNRVVITARDKQFMRELGMDPSNKTQLQEFAKQRLLLTTGREA